MNTDCLICFGSIRRAWTQPIPCACRPAIHKYCWDSWVASAGEVCIICHADKQGYTPEEFEQVAILIAVAPPRRYRCTDFSQQLLFVMTILWFIYLFAVISKVATLMDHGTHDEL